jgi:hypothetical protein
MSWDIVLFNSKQKIISVDQIDENQLEPTDFASAFENHFPEIRKEGNHWSVASSSYSLSLYNHEELVSNTIVSLRGEEALFSLVILAKKHNWQLFDTAMERMLDLDNPSQNGYKNFQAYLTKVQNTNL